MVGPQPETVLSKHRMAMFCAWFMMVFLVLFPKGGIKFGPVPLTWGYAFLGITAPVLIVIRLLAMPLRFTKGLICAIALQIPFQVLFTYAGLTYGVDNPAYFFSLLTNHFFLPAMFFLVYPPFLKLIDGDRLAMYFRWCILLAALWGIFNFFWHPITHHFVEIPYLTVNAGDYGTLEYTKHIARGLYLKLISTYNNGNLYGVCTLMLLPLYNHFEHRRWCRWTLKIALLLTLSRTVWVGIVLEQMLSFAVVLWKQLGTFPRVHLGKAAKQMVALGATIGFIFIGLIFNSSTLAFLFDATGGGRIDKLAGFFSSTLLPSRGLWAFDEVVYVSAAEYWGYSGLVAVCLILCGPAATAFCRLLCTEVADPPRGAQRARHLHVHGGHRRRHRLHSHDGLLLLRLPHLSVRLACALSCTKARPCAGARAITGPRRGLNLRVLNSVPKDEHTVDLHPARSATHPRHRGLRLHRLELRPRLARARRVSRHQPRRAHLRGQP